MIDHIKSCETCRIEYHKFLKLYYLVDYNLGQPEADLDDPPINMPGITRSKIITRNVKYAIAASFLIFIISFFLISRSPDAIEIQSRSQDKSMNQNLASEDWQEIAKIILDASALKQMEHEKIQLDLLLVKLEMLEKNRINRLKFEEFAEENLNQRIKLNSLIDTLRKYKKYNSELSIEEISKYLKLI
jgi:hypothetical protein